MKSLRVKFKRIHANCYNVDLDLLADHKLIACVNVWDLTHGLWVDLDVLTFWEKCGTLSLIIKFLSRVALTLHLLPTSRSFTALWRMGNRAACRKCVSRRRATLRWWMELLSKLPRRVRTLPWQPVKEDDVSCMRSDTRWSPRVMVDNVGFDFCHFYLISDF